MGVGTYGEGDGPEPIALFVIAEVRLYREGLSQVLGRHRRFTVIGSAPDAAAASELVGAPPPDVFLLSTGLSTNREWIRVLRDRTPGAVVVALAVPNAADDVISWVEAGASAFVTTEASLGELYSTVESAHRGEAHCSPRITAALLERLATPTAALAGPGTAALTVREREIAEMLRFGLSNKEIAARLRIEVTTVKNHVHNILEKLHVRRRAEAAVVLGGMNGRATIPTTTAASGDFTGV